MISIRDIGDQSIMGYDDLEPDAQAVARTQVRNYEIQSLRGHIRRQRHKSAENIHGAVNDPYHISRLRRRAELAEKMADPAYCAKLIVGNLMHFLRDGTYVVYS